MNKTLFLLPVVLASLSTNAFIAAQTATEALPKALKPEVQTAKWAQSWWMPRHEQKLEERKKMKQVDLLMIGDSITYGWENGGKEVWNKYYASRNALNIGFSGDRTEQVLWRFDHGEIDDIDPKLAVIMIGTNNTGHRKDPPQETADGIKAIIEKLHEKYPDTKVLLLGVFPRGASPQDELRKINDGINAIISKLDDGKKVHYLDISANFLDDRGVLPKSIMPDLLHPNKKGYALWAEAMEPSIAKLLN
ncbi:MAG: platelet-activating factor acetylhydrolase IB subunit [Planctomycetota bacterium]